MNLLEASEAERAGIPTRDRGGSRIEGQCPACGAWRPAFCIVKLDAAEAAARGTDWACDGDRTAWAREGGE